MRTAVFVVSSFLIACVGGSACTQPTAEESSSRATEALREMPSADASVDCSAWAVTTDDGVLVELTPRPPRVLWSCPVVYVGRTPVVADFSADYIAWYLKTPSQCSCGTHEQTVELMYGRSWPAVTDFHRPFCQWDRPYGMSQSALLQAVQNEVSPEAQPLKRPAAIGWCSEPGSGGCPSCEKAKMP